MARSGWSSGALREHVAPAGAERPGGGTRVIGIIVLALAGFLAWRSKWFQAARDLSQYPSTRLTYTTCRFERITHYKGSTTRQIVFATGSGRYVMESGVWGRHFDGPTLAAALSGGGVVRAWLHPDYPHVLRGIAGGRVDIPLQWGLEYDQRNARLGIGVDAVLAVAGGWLLLRGRSGPRRSAAVS
jgi:hypothetical protein